ncbi:hypothetical protein [Megamonas funiformis]|uniref:hypothetical protein n=1 Tax=Megamonas funiformis TaxID=437897 RepID=UPI003521472F
MDALNILITVPDSCRLNHGDLNDSGQWRNVTLPIALKAYVLAVGINSDDSANCGYHLNSKELNSFSYLYDVSLCYIAIGV